MYNATNKYKIAINGTKLSATRAMRLMPPKIIKAVITTKATPTHDTSNV